MENTSVGGADSRQLWQSPAFDRFLRAYARMPNHPAKLRLFHWLCRTFRKDKPLQLSVSNGLRMKLRPSDHIESCLIFNDWHEKATTNFLLANLSDGQTAFIAGAHIGYYVMHAARAVGRKGKVLACEPAPENLSNTLDHIYLNKLGGNVTLLCVALSDKSGLIPMDKPPEKSRGMAVLGKGPGDTPYLARVTTIEKVLMETQTHCPDLLQLDVEGFEWAALKGMGSLRPSVMVLEYDPKHFERTDVSQDDFRQFVSNLGYDLFTVTGDPLRTTGYVPENNMIAIKKEAPQVRWP